MAVGPNQENCNVRGRGTSRSQATQSRSQRFSAGDEYAYTAEDEPALRLFSF